MYMNLKPNRHKIIFFNTMTMASLGFIGPPQNFRPPLKFSSPPKLKFLPRPPPPPAPQLFWSETFVPP